MKKLILALSLLTTSLSFGQIKNGGFEVWDTTYTNSYSGQLSSFYGVPNPVGGIPARWTSLYNFGISRTTDSYSGNYSLIVHNWYNYENQQIIYSDTISYRPQYLQGYYKYITGGIDGLGHGTAKITLTHINGLTPDTVATATFIFDSTNYFTPFQLTLNYVSALNPDSINITFKNADKACSWQSADVCHLLYLDNLTLSNTPLGIEQLNSSENVLIIYPNPVINELNVQKNSTQPLQFSFYNSLGEEIISKLLNEKTSRLDLSHYSEGIYFYRLSAGNNAVMNGSIIKQ